MRTINILAQASTLDPSKWSKAKLEAEVLKIYNSNPARRAWDITDLHDAYSEQASEMRCNDMRPPSFKRWMEDKVCVHEFTNRHQARKDAFEASPEGAALKVAKDASFKVMMADIRDDEKPWAEKQVNRDLHDANDKAYQKAFSVFSA